MSISCRRQVLVRLARIAAVLPPRGLPTKRLFLRLRTTRFISRSETLLSMLTAPSEQNTFWLSPGPRLTGWQMLDKNQRACACAASGTKLCQLNRDGLIRGYVGMTLPEWNTLHNNSATTAIMSAK